MFDLCFTSPPYADLREYGIGDFDWLALMNGVWDAAIANASERAHIIVNLGPVHKDRMVYSYWNPWLEHAEQTEWPLFGWYVWDKGFGLCGDWGGRLAPCHEFLFHFNRQAGVVNKWVATHTVGAASKSHTFRQPDGSLRGATSPDAIGQPFKVPDSIVRVTKETNNTTGHPAVYPPELPAFGMQTWTTPGALVFDPFLGSGTTLIAAEQTGRVCYGMEILPKYCDVILARWEQYTGQRAARYG